MLIWLLERENKAAQAAGVEFLRAHLSAKLAPGQDVEWRILPASRLWAECVRLFKRDESSSIEYPDVIEYPWLWHDSLSYLGLLAAVGDAGGAAGRWQELKANVDEANPCASRFPNQGGLLTFSWMMGMTILYYRKDILRRIGKTPEDLENYEEWISCVMAAPQVGAGDSGAYSWQGLDMPLGFITALQWILNFGGEFLDPLNLMPAFHQAESLQALEAYLNVLLYPRLAQSQDSSAGPLARRSLGYESSRDAEFPDGSFCLFSSQMPAALRLKDSRVGCLLPPKLAGRAVVAEELSLGVTKRGMERGGETVLAAMEAMLGDAQAWLGAASHLGHLPAKTSMWDLALDDVDDPFAREVYYAGAHSLRWLPSSRFLAPAMRIFEETLSRLYFEALRQGSVDRRLISAGMATAASEYRLIAALYDSDRSGPDGNRNVGRKAAATPLSGSGS